MRAELIFTLTVPFFLFVFGRIGKDLMLIGRKRKDGKAVGLELSTTGIGIYSTIVGVYPKLIPIFWENSRLIQFRSTLTVYIFLLQVCLWGGTILYSRKLLRTTWENIDVINRYTLVANGLGLFSVSICFFMIFFGRILT